MITIGAQPDMFQDVSRTFPDCIHFESEEGQDKLRDILGTYAVRHRCAISCGAWMRVVICRAIGYCQSMNYLVGTCLLFMENQQAFWTMATLCEDTMPGYW